MVKFLYNLRRVEYMKKFTKVSVIQKTVKITSILLSAGIILSGSQALTAYAISEVPVVTTDESYSDLEYTVKFINYDGSELYNEQQAYGSPIITPVVPERVGFTFIGWAPEVDATVPAQDVVYTAQYQQAETAVAVNQVEEISEVESYTNGSTVVYDSEKKEETSVVGGSDLSDTCEENHFIHFLFMLIVFMMEIVWLHDRRSQQIKRYDALMDKMDKE